MERPALIKSLKQTTLFQGLNLEALEEIAQQAKFRQFFPNDTIVWQGKASDALFLIVNGIVAVKRILAGDKEILLAYLMSGSTFGEVGILENQPRSATVSALSDVDVLVIRREDFLKILNKYPSVAIELAKMLGRYLVESNKRASMGNKKVCLVMLFNLTNGGGATTLGTLVASELSKKTEKPTVYFEYPNYRNLATDFKLQKGIKTFKHPRGFDIMVSPEDNHSSTNSLAVTTIMFDQMLQIYENIVVSLQGETIDDTVRLMLDYAKQVLILVPPTIHDKETLEELHQQLRKILRLDETSVITVLTRNKPEYAKQTANINFDFELPYYKSFPSHTEMLDTKIKAPEEMQNMVMTLADRVDRTNQIALFIPTTVDVDKTLDTGEYVEQTLNFLAERFGGATSKEAQGVWNSQQAGLVGETVFIVNTYVTQAALRKHLDEVVEYVKQLKTDLKQEAMALEVNKKLTLI
jgi:CRP-like cAMP-binding protein